MGEGRRRARSTSSLSTTRDAPRRPSASSPTTPPGFGAVARLLLAGHRVLFLSGNHDVELYLARGARGDPRAPGRPLPDANRSAAPRATPDEIAASIEERVRFRAWFHVTEDRIYLEHGSQYDVFNGVPWPMLPVVTQRD